MVHKRFKDGEDRALLEIVQSQERVNWTKVVQELQVLGFPKRTPKSVRNRHLRWKNAQSDAHGFTKNYCRVCGKKQRGHVCVLVEVGVTAGCQDGETKNE